MERQETIATARHRELERKKRFHRQKTMLYRSNLLLHTQRVGYHMESLLPLAEKTFEGRINSDLTRAIAQVFDDFELDMGDYDPQQRAEIEEIIPDAMSNRRHAAHRILVKRFKTLNILGIPYIVAIGAALRRKSIEAQIVHYCDAFNGFGEAYHEYLAGNMLFKDAVQGYVAKQRDPGRYPLLRPLFSHAPEVFALPLSIPEPTGRLPTRETIILNTGYAPYDHWKANIIRIGGEEGLDSLVNQKEYPRLIETEEAAFISK